MIAISLAYAENNYLDSGILKVKKTVDFEVNGKGDANNWQQTDFNKLTHRKGNKHYTSQFKILYSDKGIY